MKMYHVSFVYRVYENYSVEANTPEEAREKAWKQLEQDAEAGIKYGSWELDDTEEV